MNEKQDISHQTAPEEHSVEETIFGKSVAPLRLGTLTEVLGEESARPILDRLEQLQRDNDRNVRRMLGRRAFRYTMNARRY